MREKLIKIMLIIILLMIILFVGGSLYNKMNNKEKEKPIENKNPTGRLDQGEALLDSSVIIELAKVFTTYDNPNKNDFSRYAQIEKLGNNLDTPLKLYFTFYALDLDKKYTYKKCSEISMDNINDLICSEKTKVYDEERVKKKYNYLFGHDQNIDVNNALCGCNRMILDTNNHEWVSFDDNCPQGGKSAETKIDSAYVDNDLLTISMVEKVNKELLYITLEFTFDEEVNHYVFSKREVS